MCMKPVRLNEKLISSLGSVLFIQTAEMIVMTDIPNSTWYRIMQTPASISIQQLLAIANGLHVPVRRFFSGDKIDYIGKRDEYILDHYEPCYYDETALQELVNSSHSATWQKASKATGISYSRLRNSLLAITRTPVARFLSVCNVFGIDPFTILVDPNPEARARKRSEETPVEGDGTEADVRNLRDNVRQLSEKVDDLVSKYENLLEAHKVLMRRLDEHISESFPSMAAER